MSLNQCASLSAALFNNWNASDVIFIHVPLFDRRIIEMGPFWAIFPALSLWNRCYWEFSEGAELCVRVIIESQYIFIFPWSYIGIFADVQSWTSQVTKFEYNKYSRTHTCVKHGGYISNGGMLVRSYGRLKYVAKKEFPYIWILLCQHLRTGMIHKTISSDIKWKPLL